MIYLMLAYVYALPSLVVAFILFSLGTEGMDIVWSFIFHALLVGIAGIIAHQRMRSFVRLRESKRLAQLERALVPTVDGIFQSLVEEFGLTDRKFVLWRAIDIGRTPSVVEYKGAVHLTIPAGFIALASEKPAVAKAMLAHEMTHVLVGDTHLWTLSEAFARQLLLWAGIPWIINVLIFVGLMFYNFGWPSHWPVQGAFWVLPYLFFNACASIMELRRRSEVFADVTGASVVGPEAMIEAIQTCVADDNVEAPSIDIDPSRPTATHPPKLYRIARLQNLRQGANPFGARLVHYHRQDAAKS